MPTLRQDVSFRTRGGGEKGGLLGEEDKGKKGGEHVKTHNPLILLFSYGNKRRENKNGSTDGFSG